MSHFQGIAATHPLSVQVTDRRNGRSDSRSFCYPDGVRAILETLSPTWIAHANGQSTPIGYKIDSADGYSLDVAVRFLMDSSDRSTYFSWVNGEMTPGNGSHVDALGEALYRLTMSEDCQESIHGDVGQHGATGLQAAVSVWAPNPHWYGASRDRIDDQTLYRYVYESTVANLGPQLLKGDKKPPRD